MKNRFVHSGEDGELLVRDKLILAFFARRFDAALLGGTQAAFDKWLTFIPQAELRWAAIGPNATRIRALSAKTLGQCRAQIDPAKGLQKKLLFFMIQGQELANPSYLFKVLFSAAAGQQDSTSNGLVEMHFPAETAASERVEGFVEFALQVARDIPYDSGYASLLLSQGAEYNEREACKIITPLALRHPGMDVAMNEDTATFLGSKCRGARWLTLLGPTLLRQLGEERALRARLEPAVEILPAGRGVALRAGKEPTPGDFNRKDTLPLIASVARALEPVTFFGDENLCSHMFLSDEDKFQRWERRFLSGGASHG